MNINEKQKEETKLICIYRLVSSSSLHTSESTLLKHYGKRDLLNVKVREKNINSAKVHVDNAYVHGFHSNRYCSSNKLNK